MIEVIDTEDGFNSDIGDGIDYLDPMWLVLSDAVWWQSNALSGDTIGWNSSGSGAQNSTGDGEIVLQSGGTSGSHVRGYDYVGGQDADNMTWDKDRAVEFAVDFVHTEGPLYICNGTVLEDDKTFRHFGFAMDGNDLVATCADGVTQSTAVLASAAATGDYRLRAHMVAGDSISFEVISGPSSGSATLSANIPTGVGLSNRGFMALAQNQTANNRRMDIASWKGIQAP